MEPERVDEMLSKYREHSARYAALCNEIADLEALLESMRRTVVQDTVSTTSVVTGMPRGTITSDPTGRLGTLLASGAMPAHIRELEDELLTLRQEADTAHATVRYVDSWLLALNEKQAFIVRRKLDGLQWREIVYDYTKEFGTEYSKNGIRKIYKSALCKIYKAAGVTQRHSGRKVAG